MSIMAAKENQVLQAVQSGDIDEVRSLMEKGANINVFTSGRTPLGIAAHQGNVPMLELLLNCGQFKQIIDKKPKKKSKKNDSRKDSRITVKKRKAIEGNNGYYEVIHDDKSDESESDVNRNVSIDEAETPEGMDNLEWDVELNAEDEPELDDDWSDQYRWYAKILANTCHLPCDLPYACDVNLQDSVGRCAIHYASEYGHVNAVKLLLNAGCKADIGDVDSLTPLHLAANGGHVSVVETLLSSGCLVNAKTTDKLSPLHYASAKGHTDVVTILLDSGAHVDSLDEGERTPLILAVSRNLENVAEVLIKRGARVNIEDVKGYTALSEAVWCKSVPMVKSLLNAGAKIVPTHYLLHYAVLHHQPEMVKTLLAAGAFVNIRDTCGDTPLISAAVSAQPEMVRLLLSHGASADYIGGCSERTPLYCTVLVSQDQCPEVLRLLIENGADMERETWGQTPLACALAGGKERTVVCLVSLGAVLRPAYAALVLRSNSIAIAKAFVYSGYDCESLFSEISPPSSPSKWPIEINSGLDWLTHTKYNPLSLAELSRIAVRSLARPKFKLMSSWISSIILPRIIKRYLMLDDVMDTIDMANFKVPMWPQGRDFTICNSEEDSPGYSDDGMANDDGIMAFQFDKRDGFHDNYQEKTTPEY